MKLFLVCFFMLYSVIALSQYSISGKLSDEKKQVRNASVELLRSSDSVLIKSTLSDIEGNFIINNVMNGNYVLSVSMVGYKRAYTPVQVSDGDVQVNEIKLLIDAGTLQGVTVTATKPFLEQRADKLVVNVENSATAAGSTALEVLQKVPGIIVTNEKVTLVGKSSINIMIDGRPSQYMDITQVLRDMPSSNIEKIEVIHNPGAKYDASGGAIINIILKRSANLGMNGNASLTTGMGLYNYTNDTFLDRKYYRVSPAINLNYRKDKWNLYGGYNFLHRNAFEQNVFDREVQNNRFIQTNYIPSYVNSHNFRLGVDYFINKKNTVGILLRGFDRHGDITSNNITEHLRLSDAQLVSTFTTLTANTFKRRNFSTNVNLKHSFDTAGRELNIDFDYSIFQLDNYGDITITQATGAKSINRQVVDNPVKFGVFKMDYSHPLNKNSKWEGGLKSTMANIDNYLTFIRNGSHDPNASSDFLYKENINAAYFSYILKSDDWDFTAGLRAEQTIAKGNTRNVKTLDRNYVQYFPSAFLKRSITKDLAAVAQYSKRVNRPSYQQQNPFSVFMDSLTYTRGNPLIKPEITNASKVSLTYQGQPFFGVSYNITNDVIFQNAPRQQGNLAYATPENLGRFTNVSIELNFPIKFGNKISGFGGNQAIYNHYKANYLGGIYDQSKWNWIAYGQVAFKPTETFTIEMSGFYSTRFLNEFIMIDPLGNLNFAIQKSFWERKGRLSLNINDIFYSNKTKADIKYQDIFVKFNQRNETRNLRLVFTYSFGNQKLNAVRTRTTASDTETNRVKTN